MTERIPIDEMKYEQAFAELEQIIASLESDQSGLDDAIALFERGRALVQRCGELLDGAELRIRQLTAGDLEESGAEEG